MEVDKLYSIGKISSLMGISVQTLRFWEKIGLLQPSYINPESGYRYYEYSQMHKIDRIKYLQKLGITLNEIIRFYESENTEEILTCLHEQQERAREELKQAEEKLNELSWYQDYFAFMQGKKHFGLPYLKHFDTRYALVVPMGAGVPFSDTNERFYALRNRDNDQNTECLRQYVSVLDATALKQGRTTTLLYGLYLKRGPSGEHPHIITFPAGEYICFLARIYREDLWSPDIFSRFLEPGTEYLVIADEYEDNLHRYDSCMYEIRLIEKPIDWDSLNSVPQVRV